MSRRVIEERRVKGDWKTRVWLFDVLVWSIMSYRVEEWGSRKIVKMKKMH